MQPALRSPIPDASLAVFPVNGENSHQGFEGRNPALHPVREACKFTVLLGLRGQAELNRIGSRCTGKERDAESGNDYFGARYYASTVGRFLSTDWNSDPDPVPYADLENPQSLNLYGYAGNNPLIHIDADGHCWPQVLCDFVTEVKNKVFHGEFTTDTTGAKIRQLDRQEAKTRQMSRIMEEMKTHPPEVKIGVVFTPFTSQFIGATGRRPSFIPDNWNVTDPGRGRREGLKFQDPNNPHNNVRIMKGDPNSSNPGQQQDYMVVRKNGATLDASGNPSNDPADYHIPEGTELPPDIFGPLP
jgi:RHS repeat-associated protein